MSCCCTGGPGCCIYRYSGAYGGPWPVPGPFKCPDCGMWWYGYSHLCLPARTDTTTSLRFYTNGSTVRCSCPPKRGDNYYGSCPIHDVTMTSGGAPT